MITRNRVICNSRTDGPSSLYDVVFRIDNIVIKLSANNVCMYENETMYLR